jgi:hypothetical protein
MMPNAIDNINQKITKSANVREHHNKIIMGKDVLTLPPYHPSPSPLLNEKFANKLTQHDQVEKRSRKRLGVKISDLLNEQKYPSTKMS